LISHFNFTTKRFIDSNDAIKGSDFFLVKN